MDNKRIKVLVITPYYKPSYKYGGPVNSISRISEALSSHPKIDIHVFTANGNGNEKLEIITKKQLEIDGVKVTFFNKYFNNNFFISPSFLSALVRKIHRFDIVHVNMWWNWLSISGAIAAVLAGKKLIISPRSNVTEYILNHKNRKVKNLIHESFGRKLLSQAYFHITANLELDDVKKLAQIKQYSIIPNLINLPDITYKKTVNNIFTIIFLSRIDRKKGLDILFESLSLIKHDFRIKIAGDGDSEYMIELKTLASQLKIEDKIIWLGWLNNEEKFVQLASSDLFALTSHNENFANVVIESLYVSTPVLISDGVGLHDYVASKNLGWVTRCEPVQIAEALNNIIESPDKLKQMSERARPAIMDSFPEDKLVSQYVEMYERALHTR